MERLVDATELASLLGLHPKTVYDLARTDDIPSFKIGKARRFRLSEVELWLSERSSMVIERPPAARTLTTGR